MSLGALTGGNVKAALSERGNDLYETPPEAIYALLANEDIPPIVWEPACGPGSIVNVLRESGRTVIATDLVDYGCPDSEARRDFLFETTAPQDCECIVTNPPYKLAGEFAERGLRMVPKVVMLLRLGFLESERRRGILDGGQLARVHVFRNRLPRMHRAGWTGKESSSSIAFAWFVWEHGHNGPTELRRISWVPA